MTNKGNETQWTSVKDKLPHHFQRVICKYEGVYDDRIVTFWNERDSNTGHHFGLHTERDGRGSQPATHWRPL